MDTAQLLGRVRLAEETPVVAGHPKKRIHSLNAAVSSQIFVTRGKMTFVSAGKPGKTSSLLKLGKLYICSATERPDDVRLLNLIRLPSNRAIGGIGQIDALSVRVSTFADMFTRITSFDKLAPGWNGDSSERPSEQTIRAALLALMVLTEKRLYPSRVNPLADEGIGIEIDRAKEVIVLDIYNSGTVVLLRRSEDGGLSVTEFGSSELVSRLNQLSE